jgi:hypothetical protein
METSPALAGLFLALRTLAAPGLAGIAVWAAAARPLPRLAAPAGALAGLLLGWALGFGHQAAFPPAQTLDWLPWLLVALALAGSLPRGRTAACAGVMVAGLAVLAPPVLTAGAPGELALALGGAGLLGLASMGAIGRSDPARGGIALAAGLGSLGLVTTLGGSIVVGGLALSAFGVAALLGLGALTGRAAAGPDQLRAGAVAWLWLAFSARHLAEVPLPELLLAAAALGSTLLPAPWQGRGVIVRRLGEILLPATPALAAIALTVWRYASAQQVGHY